MSSTPNAQTESPLDPEFGHAYHPNKAALTKHAIPVDFERSDNRSHLARVGEVMNGLKNAFLAGLTYSWKNPRARWLSMLEVALVHGPYALLSITRGPALLLRSRMRRG